MLGTRRAESEAEDGEDCSYRVILSKEGAAIFHLLSPADDRHYKQHL